MQISSPIHRKHARIEIIPLIDIMFFLLASFMMVSLSMTKVENIRVNLPPAFEGQADFGPEMLHIAVDKEGGIWVEKNRLAAADLFTALTNRFRAENPIPVYIGGDAETQHGDMVEVLEMVRRAGFQKVSFTVIPGAPTDWEETARSQP